MLKCGGFAMIFSKNNSHELDLELFKNPTAEYRGLPFWSWNCKIEKQTIDEQLLIFKEMGFGGVVIHPRDGLDTEYLGNEFMEMARYTAEKCRKMGLICWLYDDDRFPSGAADGLVTKNPRLRAREMRLASKPLDGYLASQAEFDAAVENGEIPRGYYLTAYAVKIENKYMTDYRRMNTQDEVDAAIKNGDNVRYAYLELAEGEEFFNGCTYSDTMNPSATDKFIEVTHERYKSWLGADFGTTAAAIFTDEPRIGKQQPIRAAESDEDVFVPYTEHFALFCKAERGFDPLDIAPEYVWDRTDGDLSGRHAYHDAAAECFARVFMDRICDWCRENGILMTGHILAESPLGAQTTTVGEAMRCYRKMDVPGVDMLIDGREFTSVKQAASVAAQYGREAVMSEEYGVTNWDCTFKTYKLQGDWQAALGVTIRVPHLSHMSIKGEAKRDWPGSIFYHAPWHGEFACIEDHFARLNTVLTRGERVTRAAVVNPVESLWISYGADDLTRKKRNEMDRQFEKFADRMLTGGVDFDYLSESLLPEQDVKTEGKTLTVGKRGYEVVIVPECDTLRKTTLDILKKFAANGGTVIFTGEVPTMVNAKPSGEVAEFAKKCVCVKSECGALLNALDDFRDIEYENNNLLYQLRTDNGCKWLFLCHAYPSDGGRERNTIKIRGEYSLTVYDTISGGLFNMPATVKDGMTVFEWDCYGENSILLRLDKSENGLEDYAADEFETVKTIDKIDRFNLAEPNVLLLDYARFAVDGGEMHEKTALIKADNIVRETLGLALRTGLDRQPYTVKAGETHTVTMYFNIRSEIETDCRLALEDADKCKVYLNGERADGDIIGWYVDKAIEVINLPRLKKGANELKIDMEYNAKSYLENMYLLGGFGVRGMTVTAPETELAFGDICAQGMTFYTGNVEYIFDVDIDREGEYFIRVPKFNAPVMAVYADGEKRGLIAYSPHRASLGNLSAGRHEIKIVMYGNRFNSFGALHNADENYTWYGNTSYRTTGDKWTDGYMLRPVGIMSDVVIEKKK